MDPTLYSLTNQCGQADTVGSRYPVFLPTSGPWKGAVNYITMGFRKGAWILPMVWSAGVVANQNYCKILLTGCGLCHVLSILNLILRK